MARSRDGHSAALNRPRTPAEAEGLIWRSPGPDLALRLSDGPIQVNALRERMIGRVVGRWVLPSA